MALVNRWYEILENLLLQNPMTFENLRKKLQISPQTLVKSIEQLNDVLDGDIVINQKDNQIELAVYDYARLETILAGSLRKTSDFNSSSKRVAYLLKRLLESSLSLFIDDLAEEIGVSRSTVNKDMRRVKDLANAYHVSIKGVPNRGIVASGSEMDIRLLTIHHVYNYFESDVLVDESLRFLETLYRQYRLPRKIQELLTKSISVSIERIQKKEYLTTKIPFYSNEVDSDAFMEELVFHLEMVYRVSLSQYERDFISFALNTQYIEGLTYQEGPQSQEFMCLYQRMVNEVKGQLLLHFDQEKLLDDIYTHLKFLLNRLIFHIQANDLFHGEIKHKYPLAFEMATVAGKVLEEGFGTKLELSECSYLALYFELIMRNRDQTSNSGSKKIAVVCTTGRGTANMICQRLTKVLGPDIEISRYSEEQFSPEKDDNYFAIFTTVPLKFGQLKSPLVQMTNLFNDQWLQKEWQRVHHFHQRKLQSSLILVKRLKEEASYLDYLKALATALYQEGLVDQAFSERILKREALQSTLFDNQIAFPHAINLLEQRPILLIGILEEPLKENDQEVGLIFMVAIPKSIEATMEAELLEIYDAIFKIASDDCLKKEMLQIKGQKDFQQLTEKRGIF